MSTAARSMDPQLLERAGALTGERSNEPSSTSRCAGSSPSKQKGATIRGIAGLTDLDNELGASTLSRSKS